jgi:hypothetical protein
MENSPDILAAKARARQAEAVAARREAEGYLHVARACRERATALRAAMEADQALAQVAGSGQLGAYALADARRACKQADLFEGQASRYERSARRALAEAQRAETEAGTALAKAKRVAATARERLASPLPG